MFVYEKKLQYPVKIKNTNPKLAALIISQYGGPYPHKLRKHPISGCFRVIPIKQMRGHSASHFSLSKNYANAPVSAIIEETGVFAWKVGGKMHGMSQSS